MRRATWAVRGARGTSARRAVRRARGLRCVWRTGARPAGRMACAVCGACHVRSAQCAVLVMVQCAEVALQGPPGALCAVFRIVARAMRGGAPPTPPPPKKKQKPFSFEAPGPLRATGPPLETLPSRSGARKLRHITELRCNAPVSAMTRGLFVLFFCNPRNSYKNVTCLFWMRVTPKKCTGYAFSQTRVTFSTMPPTTTHTRACVQQPTWGMTSCGSEDRDMWCGLLIRCWACPTQRPNPGGVSGAPIEPGVAGPESVGLWFAVPCC